MIASNFSEIRKFNILNIYYFFARRARSKNLSHREVTNILHYFKTKFI